MCNLKKKLLLLNLMFLLGISTASAKDLSLIFCEYSDEYIAWTKLSAEEKSRTLMPFMCKLDNNYNVLQAPNDYTLSKYSLKEYNLDVRDQKNSDSCWAFSSLASIESNLLKNGLDTGFLSVAHLELATQNSLYDPSHITFNRTFNSGGQFINTTAYVLNNWGPIEESSMPLNNLFKIINKEADPNQSYIDNQKAVVDVDNIFLYQQEQGACTEDSITTIKKYLVSHGGIAAGIYFKNITDGFNMSLSSNGLYDLSHTFGNGKYYYYNGSSFRDVNNKFESANKLSNHAATIVGWDDNIEVSSFSSSIRPSRKGAWLVKNSYGTSDTIEGNKVNVGDNGYFYVSYDDINICTNLAGYYDADFAVSDYAYYYDDLGYNATAKSNYDTMYLGNVFTKKDPKTEKLDKVTFASSNIGTKYTVYYAANGSFRNYTEIASGETDHVGYISVIPKNDIYVTDKFSIIIKLEGNEIVLPLAISSSESDNVYNMFNLTNDVSYFSTDGEKWADLTTTENIKAQSSIRAYTSKASSLISSEVDDNSNIDDTNINVLDVTSTNQNKDVGDASNNVSNPKTGINAGISVLAILGIIGGCIYLNSKDKLWKL